MTTRTYSRLSGLTVDEAEALAAGHWCGVCLDDGWLDGIGPCPVCTSDDEEARFLDLAIAQHAATCAEDTDHGNGDVCS